ELRVKVGWVERGSLTQSFACFRVRAARGQNDPKQYLRLNRSIVEPQRSARFAFCFFSIPVIKERECVEVSCIDRVCLALRKFAKGFGGLFPLIEFDVGEAEVLPGAVKRRVAVQSILKTTDRSFHVIPVGGEQSGDVGYAWIGWPSILKQIQLRKRVFRVS